MVGQCIPVDSTGTIPVLIQLDRSAGTGFYTFANNSIYLVTAKHVLMNDHNELRCRKGTLISDSKVNPGKKKNVVTTDFDELLKKNFIKYDSKNDYIVVKMGDMVSYNLDVQARLYNPPGIFRLF